MANHKRHEKSSGGQTKAQMATTEFQQEGDIMANGKTAVTADVAEE